MFIDAKVKIFRFNTFILFFILYLSLSLRIRIVIQCLENTAIVRLILKAKQNYICHIQIHYTQ